MNIEPSFDSWTSLFLVVAVHGIVLSSIFFVRKAGRNLPNKLLGVFLLLFSLNLVGNVFWWTNYYVEFPHLIGIQGTFHFLYGPVLFLYVLSVIYPNRNWKKWDLLHLIPVVVFVVWMTPFYLQSAEEKAGLILDNLNAVEQSGLSMQAIVVVSVKSVVMAAYAAAILFIPRYIGRYRDNGTHRVSEDTRKWIQIVGWAFAGYILSYVTYFVLVETINFQVEYDYMISFAMSLCIFGIGYIELFQPSFIEEAHNGRIKYQNSSLDRVEADRYLEQLLTFMEEEKPYLDGDLKIVDLAEELSIPSHHLSQIINERLEKNFFEFVNSYRVREAKEMLSDPDKKDFKILRVAFEAGFNNKTTFNITFKQEVGTTPSQFRKEHVNGH